MDLTVIRGQHYELRRIILELLEILEEGDIDQNQLLISMKIGTLSGILAMHLAFEDNHLYPDLMDHGHHEVRSTVVRYKEDMGDLSQRFNHYMDKYLKHPQAISNAAQDFVADTKTIVYAIKSRIEHEEYSLFPLLYRS